MSLNQAKNVIKERWDFKGATTQDIYEKYQHFFDNS